MSKVDYLIICSLVLTLTTLNLGRLWEMDEVRENTNQIENENGAANGNDVIDQSVEEDVEEQNLDELLSEGDETMIC